MELREAFLASKLFGNGGGGGGNAFPAAILEGTWDGVLTTDATYVKSGAFSRSGSICGQYIKAVNLPEASVINEYAFYSCASLSAISLPKAVSLYAYAFGNFKGSEVYLPEAKLLSGAVFSEALQVQTVNCPKLERITGAAFWFCKSLTTVGMPLVTATGAQTFQYCSSLSEIALPLVKSIGTMTFANCASLQSVSFPELTFLGDGAFSLCSNLTTVYAPKLATLSTNVFAGCSALSELYLYNSSVVTLANINAFSGCNAQIIVPASLYSAYIVASRWSTLSSRIVSAAI